MQPIELTDSLGNDPTHIKWENSVSSKIFDLTVSGAFITVLIRPLINNIGTLTKQTTIKNQERSKFEFNFEEHLSNVIVEVNVDDDHWDKMKSELG